MTIKSLAIKHKKQLFSLSIATAMLTVSACADKKRDNTTITIKEFALVDSKNFNHHMDVSWLTVSGDGKNIYVGANGQKSLFHHGDVENLNSDWTQINLATGLDGSVGKAKLETAFAFFNISATTTGALVSVYGGNLAAVNLVPPPGVDYYVSDSSGVFHVEGNSHKAAWTTNAADLGAVPAPRQLNKLVEKELIVGIAVAKDGKDVPYFKAYFDRNYFMSKADLKAAVADQLVTASGAGQITSGGDYLFSVDSLGVRVMPKDKIGTTAVFTTVVAADAENANGTVGSDKFKMAGAKVADVNNQVSSLMVSGDNLFIGLSTDPAIALSGGVAVYEIKAPGTAPVLRAPDLSWKGVSVSSLIKDDAGTVWAVSGRNIFKAEATGVKGERYVDSLPASDKTVDNPVDGYKKYSFPNENINSAAFVGGELVMATAEGLYCVKKTEKTVAGSKIVNAK